MPKSIIGNGRHHGAVDLAAADGFRRLVDGHEDRRGAELLMIVSSVSLLVRMRLAFQAGERGDRWAGMDTFRLAGEGSDREVSS